MNRIIIAILLVFVFSTPAVSGSYRVTKVIEGDLIEIDYKGRSERVRMLHVDTPDSSRSSLGRDAWHYTRRRLQHKKIDLEFQSGLRRAGFNHLLAYVILNGRNFSLDLVRKGWSQYDTRRGTSLKYHAKFVIAQRFAQSANAGIWAGDDR